MKTLSIVLTLISFSFSINAQNQIVWKGGTPGMTTEWNISKNWIPNRIPSMDDLVIIPDCSTSGGFYPVLDDTVETIGHLTIDNNAILTLKPGAQLVVDGSHVYNDGITLKGTIVNNGSIEVYNAALDYLDYEDGQFINKGMVLQEQKILQAIAKK